MASRVQMMTKAFMNGDVQKDSFSGGDKMPKKEQSSLSSRWGVQKESSPSGIRPNGGSTTPKFERLNVRKDTFQNDDKKETIEPSPKTSRVNSVKEPSLKDTANKDVKYTSKVNLGNRGVNSRTTGSPVRTCVQSSESTTGVNSYSKNRANDITDVCNNKQDSVKKKTETDFKPESENVKQKELKSVKPELEKVKQKETVKPEIGKITQKEKETVKQDSENMEKGLNCDSPKLGAKNDGKPTRFAMRKQKRAKRHRSDGYMLALEMAANSSEDEGFQNDPSLGDAINFLQWIRNPTLQNLAKLRRAVKTNDKDWMKEFLEFDGLGLLFQCLKDLSAIQGFHLTDMVLKMECIMCIREVVNSQTGLDCLLQIKGRKDNIFGRRFASGM